MSDTRWTLAWGERPAEEARNLNPAFCAELLARTVAEHYKARRVPLNIATAFLVLPLSLHKPTRTALPGRANTAFASWVATNSSLLAELPGRVCGHDARLTATGDLLPVSDPRLMSKLTYRHVWQGEFLVADCCATLPSGFWGELRQGELEQRVRQEVTDLCPRSGRLSAGQRPSMAWPRGPIAS